MKKLFALITLLLSTGIQAAQDRDIYDVMYLPDAGTVYGFTTLGFGKIKLESDDLGDEDFDGFELDQTLGYALTDRFSLEVNLSYADVEGDPEGGEKYDAVKGVSDPSLLARLRTVDEVFRWDLIGGAIVNFQDREIERDGDTNNTQGGHSFIAGTELGTKTENVQWMVGAFLVHNLESETEVKTALGDGTIEYDSNNELVVRTSLLHRLHEKNFLRWRAQANFTEEVGHDRETLLSKRAPQSIYEGGLEYQYAASEDLLVRVGGTYQYLNTRTGQIDDFYGWNAYLGANYQF